MDTGKNQEVQEDPSPKGLGGASRLEDGAPVNLADLEAYAPLPWRANKPKGSSGYWYVNDSRGEEVATCYYGRNGADVRAKYIAQAVNCHDELVAACELALTAFQPWGTEHPAEAALKAILAKARRASK